jgi:hypothetical protein
MSEVPVDAGGGDVTPAPGRTGRLTSMRLSPSPRSSSRPSLYVAIEHGKTERELVAANVWPFPRAILSNGYDNKSSIAIGVSNGGVGPAKIR